MESAGQHPSDLDLELARTGEADDEMLSHIGKCPVCAQRAAVLNDFSEALRQGSPSVEIPELVEARILRQARQAASRRPRTLRPQWAAVAAAAVLLFALTSMLRSPLRSPSPPAECSSHTLSVDLNGDGSTDILDAYQLAMRVEADGPFDAIWDIDKNGTIDRRDADSLAMSIVRADSETR